MSFAAAFTIAVTSDPSAIVLNDTSTGTDTITARTINLYRADGTTVGAAINWPIGSSQITINPLTNRDYALNVNIVWTPQTVTGGSTYTASQIYAFTQYSYQFLYTLLQKAASAPATMQDENYYYNVIRLFAEVKAAENGINVGQDLAGAAAALDRAYALILNSTKYF